LWISKIGSQVGQQRRTISKKQRKFFIAKCEA
jgi:hypothetical protein